jgi:hypothetical protein
VGLEQSDTAANGQPVPGEAAGQFLTQAGQVVAGVVEGKPTS